MLEMFTKEKVTLDFGTKTNLVRNHNILTFHVFFYSPNFYHSDKTSDMDFEWLIKSNILEAF